MSSAWPRQPSGCLASSTALKDATLSRVDERTISSRFFSSLSAALQSASHESRSGHSLHGVPHGPVGPASSTSTQRDLAASQMGR